PLQSFIPLCASRNAAGVVSGRDTLGGYSLAPSLDLGMAAWSLVITGGSFVTHPVSTSSYHWTWSRNSRSIRHNCCATISERRHKTIDGGRGSFCSRTNERGIA